MPKSNNLTSPNKIMQKILNHVNEHGLSKEDFAKLTGTSKGHLTSGKNYFPSENTRQEILPKRMAGLIYLATGINPKKLLLDKIDEDRLLEGVSDSQKNKLFTSKFVDEISKFHSKDVNLKVINLPLNTDTSKYNEHYLEDIEKHYEGAKKSISVVETLFKGNNKNPVGNLTGYKEAHKELFEIIENKLDGIKQKYSHLSLEDRKKKFKYTRILCLSQSNSLHKKDKRHEKESAFLLEVSAEVLLHLNNCLKEYGDYCHFYISPFSRFRHQCLIDDDILLTEDYIKIDDCIVPDEIFVDDLSLSKDDGLKNLKDIFTKLVKISDGNIKITKKTISKSSLERIKLNLENRIEGRKIYRSLFDIKINRLYVKNKGELNEEKQLLAEKERKHLLKFVDNTDVHLSNQLDNVIEKLYYYNNNQK